MRDDHLKHFEEASFFDCLAELAGCLVEAGLLCLLAAGIVAAWLIWG